MYIALSDKSGSETQEVAPCSIIDYGTDGRIVGIEILNARSRLADGAVPVAAE